MKSLCILCGLLGSFLILSTAQAAFQDVPSSHPNYEAINYVEAKEIVEGYGDGTFKPDSPINRAELTKIIMATEFETAQIENCNVYNTNLSDVPAEAWFATFVCTAKNNGVIKGYDDGTFKPGQNVTFVEAAKIISLGFGQDLPTDAALWYRPYVEYLSEQNAIPSSINAMAKNITRGEMAEMIYRLHAAVSSRAAQAYLDGELTPMTKEIQAQVEANATAKQNANTTANQTSSQNSTQSESENNTSNNTEASGNTDTTNNNSSSSGETSFSLEPQNPMVCESCPTGFIGQPANNCSCERAFIYEQTYPIAQCNTSEFTCGEGYSFFEDSTQCGCKIKEEVVEYWLTSDETFKLNALEERAPIIHGNYEALNPNSLEASLGNKTIVLFFYADWSESSVATDKEIKERIKELPADAIVFKTDYDTELKLRDKFEITEPHSIIIIDKNNALQFKQIGFSFDNIVSVLEKIKEAESLES